MHAANLTSQCPPFSQGLGLQCLPNSQRSPLSPGGHAHRNSPTRSSLEHSPPKRQGEEAHGSRSRSQCRPANRSGDGHVHEYSPFESPAESEFSEKELLLLHLPPLRQGCAPHGPGGGSSPHLNSMLWSRFRLKFHINIITNYSIEYDHA